MNRAKNSRCLIESIERRLLMASIQVLNTNDSGAGSLRQAIADAAIADTIDLSELAGTITLASELTIEKDLTIGGPSSAELSISGGSTSRVFNVYGGTTVTIEDLTIIDGTAGSGTTYGGGVYNNGALTLNRVVVTSCDAGFMGGGIYNTASLTMNDSTIDGNHVLATHTGYGGGIASEVVGGGLVLNRCTISNNSATASGNGPVGGDAWGGGVYLAGNSGNTFTNCTISSNAANGAFGHMSGLSIGGGVAMNDPNGLHLYSSTIVNNTANTAGAFNDSYGGGIYYLIDAGLVKSSIIAGNTAAHDTDFGGTTTNAGNNLLGIYDSGSVFQNGNGDIAGTTESPVDPLIGPLADNGGYTKTHALLDGSPAIDNGASDAPDADQRGVARNSTADIGAFEVSLTNHAPAFTSTAVTDAASESPYTYNVTASDDDGDPLTISAITTVPDWLELTDNGDGTATLTGTPLNGDAGDLFVVLRVDDGTTHTDQSFTIDVAAINHAPGISPAPATLVLAGNQLNQTITATDPDGDDLSFTVVSKPAWVTVADNGDGTATLSGQPLIDDYGAHEVVLKANDGAVDSANRSFAIDVVIPRWHAYNGSLVLAGTPGPDVITATQEGNKVHVVSNGTAKSFHINIFTNVAVYGLDGSDVLTLDLKTLTGFASGGLGDDKLTGGEEVDDFIGDGGHDTLIGGPGRDRLNGHNGDDRIDGGKGNDRISGGDGADSLIGNVGTDMLFGNHGADTFFTRDNEADYLGAGDDDSNFARRDMLDDLVGQIIAIA